MNEHVQSELKKIFNGRFSTSESTRANYARGEDTYDPVLSQAVVFPETNEEVSQILKSEKLPHLFREIPRLEIKLDHKYPRLLHSLLL